MQGKTQQRDAASGQAALHRLFEEMQALMWLMPVAARPTEGDGRSADEIARAVEAEVEAGFDNMPV